VGIDPVAGVMADASGRAAAPARKGGLPNAVFVVASAEALPGALAGVADRVTVNLPWGSLLRGALALDGRAAAGVASLVAPGGAVEMLLAPAPRDRLADDLSVESRLGGSLAADWATLGLELCEARRATPADIAAARTTWARRLGIAGDRGRDRVAWHLVLRRP
jgi:16S rRNA (adenine(1408)-N(1))-methyltransferase